MVEVFEFRRPKIALSGRRPSLTEAKAGSGMVAVSPQSLKEVGETSEQGSEASEPRRNSVLIRALRIVPARNSVFYNIQRFKFPRPDYL